jgi:hypothetical protein
LREIRASRRKRAPVHQENEASRDFYAARHDIKSIIIIPGLEPGAAGDVRRGAVQGRGQCAGKAVAIARGSASRSTAAAGSARTRRGQGTAAAAAAAAAADEILGSTAFTIATNQFL